MKSAPLTGLKVLDFSRLLPGPYATMMLADLGAKVLQVVSKSYSDETTKLPPFIPDTEITASSAWLGRNKQTINLNLKKSEAQQIIYELIQNYDIVIEQFRPGVMERLGLSYHELSRINPAIIYCSLTGYGQNGSYSNQAGHDINFLARSGTMDYSGRENTGPSLTGMQIADVAVGSNHSVIGILSAVIHRDRTGEGQHIDISMLDGVIALNGLNAANYLIDKNEPSREKELLNGGSLYDFYETKDGKYISFGGVEKKFLKSFFEAIDYTGFIEDDIHLGNSQEIKGKIQMTIKNKTRREWQTIFSNIDACVEPVLSLKEALRDTHVQERELIIEIPVKSDVKVKQIATPIKFSKSKLVYNKSGQEPGLHTCDVLNELGYNEQMIEGLKAKGVFD